MRLPEMGLSRCFLTFMENIISFYRVTNLMNRRENISHTSDRICQMRWLPWHFTGLQICMYRYYGKKAMILLDEYDTPLQEAYVYGYWEELTTFIRSLFNCTFKTNPYLERGLMTGITRVSKESIFSDLNNLEVVTTTSEKYASSFGFTEKEVFRALELMGKADQKEEVKLWYDGFTFGKHTDIYNPWSIIKFLDTGELNTYWASTSENSLVSKLIREGSPQLKMDFEDLLEGRL